MYLKRLYLIFFTIVYSVNLSLIGNDASSIIIQNRINQPLEVLVKMRPPTGCIYKARVILPKGVVVQLDNVCKYPATPPLGTITYQLNPWPGVAPSTMIFDVYITDSKDKLLGVKKNVHGGQKVTFPDSFNLTIDAQ